MNNIFNVRYELKNITSWLDWEKCFKLRLLYQFYEILPHPISVNIINKYWTQQKKFWVSTPCSFLVWKEIHKVWKYVLNIELFITIGVCLFDWWEIRYAELADNLIELNFW